MQLSLIVEELTEAPVRRGRRSFFRLECKNCAASVESKTRLCLRCGAPQPVRSFARMAAVAGPFIGLGAVVAVFALCAHLLGGSDPEHRLASSAQFDEHDPSEISYCHVGPGSSPSSTPTLASKTTPGAPNTKE